MGRLLALLFSIRCKRQDCGEKRRLAVFTSRVPHFDLHHTKAQLLLVI